VFRVPAGQVERLPRVLRRLAASVNTLPLHTVQDRYLDTPTRLLMRAGVACRLRQVGQRATLTLKSLAPFREGLADRMEWREELPPGDWSWPGPCQGGNFDSGCCR
jgi:inorganic triphosphatase YgiF